MQRSDDGSAAGGRASEDSGVGAIPRSVLSWWALGLSALGLGAWVVLPLVTAVFADEYPITNTGVMPAIGTILIVVAAIFNVLCVWLWKERSTLNILAAVVTIPAAIFLGVMVGGQMIGGASGIPETTPDVAFATIEDSERQGDAVVLLLKADSDAARKLGRPTDSTYGEAFVRVDPSTRIISGESVNDVLAAKHIDVWFKGPVQESNPVRGTARTVVISAK